MNRFAAGVANGMNQPHNSIGEVSRRQDEAENARRQQDRATLEAFQALNRTVSSLQQEPPPTNNNDDDDDDDDDDDGGGGGGFGRQDRGGPGWLVGLVGEDEEEQQPQQQPQPQGLISGTLAWGAGKFAAWGF